MLSFVYAVGNGRAVKIGKSTTPEARIASLNAASSTPLVTCYVGATNGDAGAIERATHGALAQFRLKGEWFAVRPGVAIATVERVAAEVGQSLMRCDGGSVVGEAISAAPRLPFVAGYRAIWRAPYPLIQKINVAILRALIGATLIVATMALTAFALFAGYILIVGSGDNG
jgi:hypothetical protein